MAPNLSKTVIISQLTEIVRELMDDIYDLKKKVANVDHKVEKNKKIDSLIEEHVKDRIDENKKKCQQQLAEMISENKPYLSGQNAPVTPNSSISHCTTPSTRSARLRTPQSTPSRPEKCPVRGCGTRCKNKETLRDHIQNKHAHRSPLQNKHDEEEEDDDSLRSHKCSVSESGFDCADEKKAHEIQMHLPNNTQDTPYKARPCSVCDEQITNKEEENEHRDIHFPKCSHDKVLYAKCVQCGATNIGFKSYVNIVSSTQIELSNLKMK